MKIKIAPSILSANFANLETEIKALENLVDMWHIDVMDGHFVPNITIGVPVVESLRKITELPLDTHLMIMNPMNFVEAFAKAGSDIITVHVETIKNAEIFDKIHEFGKNASISLNPDTTLEKIEPYLDKVDMVLIMSVNPGFSGQGFIDTTAKIKDLREKNPNLDIEIDGGIKLENVQKVVDAGANIIVSGSGIFNSMNPVETVKEFRKLAEKALKGV